MRLALGIALVLPAAIASAAPPYLLEDLLPRAETVMLARVVPGERVTVQPSRVFRGPSVQTSMTFALATDSRPLAPGLYLVISQGDAVFGPPRDEIRLDQPLEGQRGYRGWIAMPITRTSHERIDTLESLVRRRPYAPNL